MLSSQTFHLLEEANIKQQHSQGMRAQEETAHGREPLKVRLTCLVGQGYWERSHREV